MSMKKRLLLPALLLSGLLAAQTYHPDYQDGKIWFKLKDDYRVNAELKEDPHHLPFGTLPFLQEFAPDYELTNLSRPFFAAKNSPILQRTYLLQFSDYANVDQIIYELRLSGQVEYAERVPLDRPTLTPNDPNFGSQWHLNTILAGSAWNFFSTGSTRVIAIVDDAVERTHSDLAPNLWVNPGEINGNSIDDDGNGYVDDINGYDVASNDNNPNPPNSTFDHGTHVAGISSAASNNSAGVASIGYSCKLMCVKSTTSASVVTNGYDGIVYAVSAGAHVINMSWGGTGSSTTAQNVITWASQQGVVLVAAAGNNNVNTQFYPAAYTECIAVASTAGGDVKSSFSNYGSWVDISAPGSNIYSTYVGNTYGNMSGTSMASPLVAGLCGLMRSLNPSLTATDIRNCLTTTAASIAAQNPSFIGQLGSGRIDANAAMTCISATLNWAPQANFVANVTTVTAGGSVNFTDLSVYNPTTWSWSFPGGTPASFNGQNPPPIVYSTPGTYNVSLTVTNANGTDVQTNTNYITVTAASGCTKINLPAPVGWTPVNYYTGTTVGSDGWINGNNVYDDQQKAMYYDASSSPYNQLVNVWVAFGRAYSANPAKIVPIRIYDGTAGPSSAPGGLLGTVNLTMGQIMSDVSGGFYTEASFVNSPVTLPASKRFFVSVDVSNLQWGTGVFDTLSVVSNTNGQTTAPIPIWEQWNDLTWHQYTTGGSWNLSASLYIHPFLTGANSVATFTQSATSVCQGSSITFDATGSTYEDTLLWYFPGGTPIVSNDVVESTIYNTPGNYQAILYIIGGGCLLFDSAFVNITVNANPTVSVSATQTTLCPGGSATLTASGAQTYTWSPGTGLNTTVGSTVVATPPSTITYNVLGVASNGCENNSTITINVDNTPVASAVPTPTFVCIGQPTILDGSLTSDATTFSWSMPGGTPSTSTTSSPSVTYSAAGTYTVTLIASNSCGADTTVTTVGVGCVDINAIDAENSVNAFYNSNSMQVDLSMNQMRAETYTVRITDAIGRIVLERQVKMDQGAARMQFDLTGAARGMYSVQVTDGALNYVKKFVVN